MELLEIEEKKTMQREEAANLLRRLADELSRHNALDFNRKGMKIHVAVAKQVEVELEVEVETDKSKLEIEISW